MFGVDKDNMFPHVTIIQHSKMATYSSFIAFLKLKAAIKNLKVQRLVLGYLTVDLYGL